MGKTNQSLAVRLKAIAQRKSELGTQKQVAANNAADISLLRIFFDKWAKEGYSQALTILPKDNPDTTENEEISEEDLKKRAEKLFKKPWEQIVNTNDGVDDVSELKNNMQALMSEVRKVIGQQMFFQQEIDSLTSEEQTLRMIQKQETSSDK